jgi:hypothetical protein
MNLKEGATIVTIYSMELDKILLSTSPAMMLSFEEKTESYIAIHAIVCICVR